jgi:hypothetical protein
MLPVVRGDRETTWQMPAYSVALVAATLVPVALHLFGVVYLAVAAVLGPSSFTSRDRSTGRRLRGARRSCSTNRRSTWRSSSRRSPSTPSPEGQPVATVRETPGRMSVVRTD